MHVRMWDSVRKQDSRAFWNFQPQRRTSFQSAAAQSNLDWRLGSLTKILKWDLKRWNFVWERKIRNGCSPMLSIIFAMCLVIDICSCVTDSVPVKCTLHKIASNPARQVQICHESTCTFCWRVHLEFWTFWGYSKIFHCCIVSHLLDTNEHKSVILQCWLWLQRPDLKSHHPGSVCPAHGTHENVPPALDVFNPMRWAVLRLWVLLFFWHAPGFVFWRRRIAFGSTCTCRNVEFSADGDFLRSFNTSVTNYNLRDHGLGVDKPAVSRAIIDFVVELHRFPFRPSPEYSWELHCQGIFVK